MPSWVHTDAQQLHSLPAWCLSVNSCAFLKWICLRTLSPTLFYSLSEFSAVCLFFLCLIELSGPAHWHDNSLKMLWSLMHICRFHFIGAILFLYQIILLLTIFTCIITLKRNHDIFFLCCLSLQNLMGRSWLLFPLTVLRNESIYTEN